MVFTLYAGFIRCGQFDEIIYDYLISSSALFQAISSHLWMFYYHQNSSGFIAFGTVTGTVISTVKCIYEAEFNWNEMKKKYTSNGFLIWYRDKKDKKDKNLKPLIFLHSAPVLLWDKNGTKMDKRPAHPVPAFLWSWFLLQPVPVPAHPVPVLLRPDLLPAFRAVFSTAGIIWSEFSTTLHAGVHGHVDSVPFFAGYLFPVPWHSVFPPFFP